MPTVSIVIVCMNNLKNLYPCLDSIKKYTTVSYETLVVAYLFSKENLQKLKKDYPWITIIESNEIRGFSENNNLALRKAKGEYCFVLNDDTYFEMDVIGGLVHSIKELPESVAIVSPNILNPDHTVQFCGRPPMNWKTSILREFNLWKENPSEYTGKEHTFKSFNIVGAAFLIKTKIFKELGWFDEYYFFCPEDIALSTLLNKKGFECYVNANIKLIHTGGESGKSLSLIQTATRPAGRKGGLKFYSQDNKLLYAILAVTISFATTIKFFRFRIKSLFKVKPNYEYTRSVAEKNMLYAAFNKKSPKEIFIQYYANIK